MELSIIIPVYNSASYLKTCLDSIVASPIKEMECILVNDGSVDESETILREYEQKDNRLKVISQVNAGVSAARNTGLLHASGTYIMFLDADDYMEVSAWKTIQKQLRTRKYEFIGYSYYTLYENGQSEKEPFPFEGRELEDETTIREYSMASSKLNMCWGKLFYSEIIRQLGLKFDTDLVVGEDYIFVSEYLRNVSTCLLSNECILYYRQHESSAMRRYDMKTRLAFMKQLYEYNKQCVLEVKDQELLNQMYIYYLRLITNLSLEFAKHKKGKELRSLYDAMLNEPFVKEILSNVNRTYMPSKMKDLEYKLLIHHRVAWLTHYFKMKAQFAK